jgi:hypothetical protein
MNIYEVLLKDLTGFFQEKFIKIPVEKDPVLGNQKPGQSTSVNLLQY